MSYYKFCFSPTGGTKKVADAVAEGWGETFREVDMMTPERQHRFNSHDICLFAVPSYGGRVPGPVMEQLGKLYGNGARAVMIVAFGNRAIDDTLLELSDGLKHAGFRCVAEIEAVAEHSLMRQYGAGRPDAADVEELKKFAVEIRTAFEEDSLPIDVTVPGNRPYQKYNGVPLKPYVTNGCIGCGLCAQQCPAGAIPMTNFRSTDTKKCISCMRCVEICPQKVRKVSKVMSFVAARAMKKVCTERKGNKLYLS